MDVTKQAAKQAAKNAKQAAKSKAKQQKFRNAYKKRQQKIDAKQAPGKGKRELTLALERETGKTVRTGQLADIMKTKYQSETQIARDNRDAALAYYNAQITNSGDSNTAAGSSNSNDIGDTNNSSSNDRNKRSDYE